MDRIGLIRLYALLVLGSLVLHEVRYALPSGQALEGAHGGGHGYLAIIGPLAGMIAALVVASGVLRAATAAPTRSTVTHRVIRLWPLLSLGVFGLFAGQELLEGLLSHHHPGGMAAVFGAGSWIGAPAALLIGAALALTVRVAQAAAQQAQAATAGLLEIRFIAPVEAIVLAGRDVLVPRAAPPRHRAGRGPPQTV